VYITHAFNIVLPRQLIYMAIHIFLYSLINKQTLLHV